MHCSECGYRFRTSASSEGDDVRRRLAELRSTSDPVRRQQLQREIEQGGLDVMAGMCPMCRQTMLFRTDDLPPDPAAVDFDQGRRI